MQRNKIARGLLGVLLAAVMLLSVLPTLALPAMVAASGTTWYVDDSGGSDFTTIQAAVAAASAGDTIIVRDGTYNENVIIDNYITPGSSGSGAHDRTGLTLRSENGRGAVTINSLSTSNAVFDLRTPGVTIDGFTIHQIGESGSASAPRGIYASANANYGSYTIINNALNNVGYGIDLEGYIGFDTISNNLVSTGNYTSVAYGIYIMNNGNNTLTNNTCTDSYHLSVSRGIYLYKKATVTSLCQNNTITGNTVDGAAYGLYLYSSAANQISNNTLTNNKYGVYCKGTSAVPTTGNVIYLNNIINSTTASVYLYDTYCTGNTWNSQTAQIYWFNSASHTGYVGNYWSNYAGTDADRNGIGDTAYQTRATPDEFDGYPLMGEWHDGVISVPAVAPVAAFSVDATTGTPPLTVHFTDQSTGYPTSWAWDFENDGVVDSTAQNPTHIYSTAGTYTVKLTATNAYGSDDETKTDYIVVSVPTYTITASAGAHGSIDPSGSVTVSEGGSQSFAISADTGYQVADVLVDGGSVGAVTSYDFTGVTAPHTISASFAINTYTITASAGAHGSISPSGAVTVNYGESQTFDIAADSGYNIVNVLVDGASVGAVTSYTFTGVTAAHTISASFTETIPDWDLNGDGTCNIGDVVSIGLYWNETGTPGWIPQDLNSDGTINIGDIVVLGLHWGESW